MATRSIRINLHNYTGFILVKVKDELPDGEWTKNPPDIISNSDTIAIGSESGGDIPILGSIATGTEGSMQYTIDDGSGFERKAGIIVFDFS